MFDKKLQWNHPDDIESLERIVRSGGVFIAQSDTVLGLFSSLTQQGFELLNVLKKRYEKPYIILISSPKYLKNFSDCQFDERLYRLINSCWPGPVTLIFKARHDLSPWMKSSEGTIALRVPQHKGLLALLARIPGLFSTSANYTGEPIPQSLEQVDQSILKQVACIVTDEDNGSSKRHPSTILDCTGSTIKVVREGAYPSTILESIYGDKFER